MRNITVAAIQMQCSTVVEENLKKAEEMVRKAAGKGAQVILLPELFEREYFCQQKRYDFYEYALPVDENPAVQMGKRLARELDVVLPISFYERDGNVLYNSLAWIDADGELLGVYRKTLLIIMAELRCDPPLSISISVAMTQEAAQRYKTYLSLA